MSVPPCFFHVDLDAFFASVEQLDHPEYRGKPVIVSGSGRRAVVSTCSYEARTFGVHSAMPRAQAERLCPGGIFLPVNMPRYHEKSREVMRIFREFSADVRQMSVDEAFLDMRGMERIFGPPEQAARKLKQAVRDTTGLTVSVGVAGNKYLAKIASGFRKPDGLTIVPEAEAEHFMAELPLKDVWGAGKKTQERLRTAGLATTARILAVSEALLQSIIGEAAGRALYLAVRGQDPGFFSDRPAERSVSNERTFEYDIRDYGVLETMLFDLSQELVFRMFDEGVSSRTVSIKIRYDDFRTVSAQSTGESPVNDSCDLFDRLRRLLSEKYERGKPVRLLGAGLLNLYDGKLPEQGELFDTGRQKRRTLEKTVFALNKKMGKGVVAPARLLDIRGNAPHPDKK